MRAKFKRIEPLKLPIILLIVMLVSAHCTYITPETENPLPGLESPETMGVVKDSTLSIRKSFFGIQIDQTTNTVKNQRFTWLCGWAPVKDIGKFKNWRGLSATPYSSRHCNIEFHISTDAKSLEAREVDVDYPDYKDWPILLSIPIKQHYYYEKELDSRGRELNRYVKNIEKKNALLAPVMDLDLAGINFSSKFRDPGVNDFYAGSSVNGIYDVEFTSHKGKAFLAFTLTQTNNRWGNLIQKDIRYNFLQFEGTKGFKKTPYHPSIAKHMNILHILGSRPNGVDQIDYAGHWDLQEPVEFCLNGFPEDERNYRQIGVDAIAEMNKMLKKIKAVPEGKEAFIVSDKKMKYSFDLRCPSITWIDDTQLSLGAPLGIGLTNANVRTGEILWGGAVIWGGLIDYFVNRDSESVSTAINRNLHEMLSAINEPLENPYFHDFSQQLNFENWPLRPGFKTLEQMPNYDLMIDPNNIASMIDATVAENKSFIDRTGKTVDSKQEGNKKTQVDRGRLLHRMSSLLDSDKLNKMKPFLQAETGQDLQSLLESYPVSDEESHLHFLKEQANLLPNISYDKTQTARLKLIQQAGANNTAFGQIVNEFSSGQGTIHDVENRFDKHYYEWQQATEELSPLEKLAAARSMIKNVTLHELGHVSGLGHQFAGNQLPERGTVPDEVYKHLEKEAEQFLNFSSIMDYQSGQTEIRLPYEKVKLQKQDELVLRYLYTQKFSAYKAGDDKFTFYDVPRSGILTSEFYNQGETYKTTYMPQCNDMEAWLATNPYCSRWDRGYNSYEIVKERFKSYSDTFVSRINSFTSATGEWPYWANWRLLHSTYRVLNNNRTMYDHLRYQLRKNPTYSAVFEKIKKSPEALYGFSKSCINPAEAPGDWDIEFAKLSLQPTVLAESELDFKQRQKMANYKQLLEKFKIATRETKNLRELDSDSYLKLEEKMYAQGVQFTELQKLCRSTKKSLNIFKTLLSLRGPDHINIDYDDAIVPTGIRGGNSRANYSKIWGRYNQLGLLPIKIASLVVLSDHSSTMNSWYWSWNKPKFSNPYDGKTGYFSLYPEEFTDIIGTAVKTNMGFGGTSLQDSASLSVANLYMSYFLFQTLYLSNDGKVNGFDSNYIDELRAQTNFKLAIYPVLLESINKPGKPKNKVFGFNPKIFNFAKRKLIDLPEAYVLPNRQAIIRGNDSQIIMPLTKLRFIDQSAAYIWALDITYDSASRKDPLDGFSVKNSISSLTNQELDKCMGGTNGLSAYFNGADFEGFTVDPDIALDKESQFNFEESVDGAFQSYQSKLSPSQQNCQESIKGVGLISATALSLRGWIIPQVYDYFRK